MNLIMSGGGESEHFEDLDKYFLSQLSQNPTLLLIPMAGEPDSYDDALDRIVDTFSTIHFENIEMCLELDSLDWDYLKNFDAIYIDGGNTFRLMDQVRKSHFYELLRKFIHHGGVINGDSAGAIIMGSHLETAHFGEEPDENESNLISYQGLNLLDKVAIHCHYEQSEEEEISEFVKEYGFPVLALDEDGGLAIKNKEAKVIGKKDIHYYTLEKKEVHKPGAVFKLY